MKINNYVVEGLVNTRTSMFVMATIIVRELGIMHLVTESETYKIASRIITQAMGRIDEVLAKVRSVQCTITFTMVGIDSYDILLGLDFLIKISAIVDVERGLIQVRHGLGPNVEVLLLTMVNMLQKMNLEAMMHDVITALENAQITNDSNMTIKISYQYNSIIPKGVDVHVLDLDTNTNNSEHCDKGSH